MGQGRALLSAHFPEYTFFCASPMPQWNDRVAGALQQEHKCCSGLWGANNAGDGGVQTGDGFQPWEQSTLYADHSLLLPGDSACPWCWQGKNWQLWDILFGVCTRDWREVSVLPHSSGGRWQWVALVCSNGLARGCCFFAVALYLAACMLGLPKTASSWVTEICTPFHRKVWYK